MSMWVNVALFRNFLDSSGHFVQFWTFWRFLDFLKQFWLLILLSCKNSQYIQNEHAGQCCHFGIFWNIFECFGLFRIILDHVGTFWNISWIFLGHFWDIFWTMWNISDVWHLLDILEDCWVLFYIKGHVWYFGTVFDWIETFFRVPFFLSIPIQ